MSGHARISRERPAEPPASFAQERLWMFDRMGAGAAFNMPGAVRLSGPLDAGALERALAGLTRRHETLRTSLAEVGGRVVQRVAPEVCLPLERRDLRGLPAADREREVERLIREQAARPFDLGRAPMMRAALFVLGEREHVLSMTLHHAITDGWSMERVLPLELRRCYEAALRGADAPPPDFRIQYADFAHWQRERSAGKDQLAFWRARLAGVQPLELPTDRPRPPVQVFRSVSHPFTVPPRLVAALRPVGREAGYTPAMLLLAAWKLLLARYSGQEDLAVGTVNAGRSPPEIEPLIGNFTHTLMVRTDLSGDPRFQDELLPRVREASLLAYENQDVPFERVVEELNPARDASRHALFQVMFGMQYSPALEARMGPLGVSAIRLPFTRTGVDLDLRFVEEGGRLTGQLAYDSELFEQRTIERMGAHLLRILEGLAAHPNARISELALLGPEEQSLLASFNATGREQGPEACAHELFEQQAARTPDAVALVAAGVELTYRALDERAERVASLLVARGVGRGSIVGLFATRSPEQVAALLGILKAGAAYVPLDPAHPVRRLRFVLDDTGTRVVLAPGSLLTGILGWLPGGVEALALDGELSEPREPARERPAVGPDDPAYVIPTSGSTGEPKAVVGLHRGIVNRLRWQWDAMPWEPGEVASHQANAVFVDAVAELLAPLCAGVPTVLVPQSDTTDPHALVRTLAGARVTRLLMVPSYLNTVLEVVPDLGTRLPDVRHWTLSGERLTGRLAARLLEQFPRATLWNLYGSTELAGDATVHEVRAGEVDPLADVPIGRPISNTRCHVLDRWRQPVPPGLPGELHVEGACVAAGYLGRSELTAERFVSAPSGARLFATGDRVRQRPDGVLEFLGRRDDQLTLRGFRIEPGEVEAALAEHRRVRRAVVVAAGERLVAYVVPERGPGEGPASGVDLSGELQAFLRERLPAFMVPGAFVALDEIPRTSSGKVDRGALPAPPPRTDEGGGPRDPLELQLAQIWERVLGVEGVGIDDDFFELGGHSLLALQLIDRVARVLELQLSPATLFTAPTIRRLAAALREAGWAARWSALVPVQPEGTRPGFFCVPPSAGVLEFRELGRRFTKQRPLYGFEHRGLRGDDDPDTSIPEMAARYVAEMRALQPEGPYHLGGHSFGGAVALEMAQQLIAAGAEVGALIILDTLNAPRPSARKSPGHYLQRSMHHLGRGQLPEMIGKNAREAVRLIRPQIRVLFKPARIRRVLIAHRRARRNYGPQAYPGRAILIQTDEGLKRENHLAWAEVCAGLEQVSVPGGHLDLLVGANLPLVAAAIERCLDECER